MSDVYENALRKLVREEMVTAAAVKRISGLDLNEVSKDIKDATGLLHTMLCVKCGSGCTYIEEEQFDNPWNKAAHEDWLSNARGMAGMHHLNDHDFLFAVTRAVSGMQNISSFSGEALNILTFFIRAHLRQAQKAATAPGSMDDQASELEEEVSDQGSG